jgi:hypothetical protein
MIAHHTQALIFQVDAYHSGDHTRAYAEVRQAHAHMFEVANVLAAAFVGHHPELFELPDTSASQHPTRAAPTASALTTLAWILVMLVAAFLAVDSILRPRARS